MADNKIIIEFASIAVKDAFKQMPTDMAGYPMYYGNDVFLIIRKGWRILNRYQLAMWPGYAAHNQPYIYKTVSGNKRLIYQKVK